MGVFWLCHVGTPGNQWTGAQFEGASLAHARTRNSERMHILKSPFPASKRFSRKSSARCTLSRARVGVFYRVPSKISKSRGLARTLELQDVLKILNTRNWSRFWKGPSRGNVHIWKGLTSFHKTFACIKPWHQQKSPNHTMPHQGFQTHPRFHPRFAHVLPTFRNGPFSVSGVCVRLVLDTIPWNLQHWGWNLTICGSFRQFFRNFGALQHFWFSVMCGPQCAKFLGICSILGS